jgi:hypothetical protein
MSFEATASAVILLLGGLVALADRFFGFAEKLYNYYQKK